MSVEQKQLTPKSLAMLMAGLLALSALSYWRLAPDRSPREHLEQVSGETMGTTYHLKVVIREAHYVDGGVHTNALVPAERALSSVDGKMSTYRDDSELSRFNASRGTEPFSVSPETAAVFAKALRVSEESAGAFDITVGPLVNAWGFGPDVRTAPPTDEDLAALRARVGYDNLSVDLKANTIAKKRPDVYCDLSAIAKGYGVDAVAEGFDTDGKFSDYFIEVGGEVRTKGLNFEGEPWRVGIETPLDTERAIERVVSLSNLAMATSGDYRNYYEEGGERLSHTIDPRTGHPITHRLASVSVIHEECAMADAYATAIMVLGEDEGMAFAEKLGLPILMLVRTADGGFEERMSGAFKRDYADEPK